MSGSVRAFATRDRLADEGRADALALEVGADADRAESEHGVTLLAHPGARADDVADHISGVVDGYERELGDPGLGDRPRSASTSGASIGMASGWSGRRNAAACTARIASMSSARSDRISIGRSLSVSRAAERGTFMPVRAGTAATKMARCTCCRGRAGARSIASLLLVAVLVAAWINRDALTFAAKLAVPGPGLLGRRRSDVGARRDGPDARAPGARDADGPTGADPAITLGARHPARRRLGAGRPARAGTGARDHARRARARRRPRHGHDRGGARRQRPHQHRRRAGAARDRHRPRRRAPVPRLHRRRRRHRDPVVGARRRRPAGGRRRRAPPRDRPAVREPQRRQPRLRPDGALWIGTGDGGGAGDRGEVAQDDGSLLGQDAAGGPGPRRRRAGAPRPTRTGSGRRSGASGCGTRGATASIGPPTASGSPTSARTPSRRSPSSTATPTEPELRVGHGRGRQRLRGRAATGLHDAGRHLRPRRRRLLDHRRATCTGATPSRACTAGTCTATTAAGFIDAVPADDPRARTGRLLRRTWQRRQLRRAGGRRARRCSPSTVLHGLIDGLAARGGAPGGGG